MLSSIATALSFEKSSGEICTRSEMVVYICKHEADIKQQEKQQDSITHEDEHDSSSV